MCLSVKENSFFIRVVSGQPWVIHRAEQRELPIPNQNQYRNEISEYKAEIRV